MSFSESLKEYMQVASLSVTRLAEMSGLSASSISRYLNDKQVPGEAAILSMSKALSSSLSDVEDGPNKDEIYSRLYKAAFGTEADYDSCIPKLKELLSALRVGNNDLARALSYDASYISRILSGSRKPSSLPQFLSDVSEYLARRFHDTSRATTIMNAVGLDSEASDPEELSDAILSWLGQPRAKETPQIAHFLGKLDEFDLNEFMASIKFDEIKVPTMPFQLPGSKTYTGISEMMQAELDFLKFAVLSKSKEDVILYSDMPLDEMSKDEEFPKKWMMGMALLIRKGLSLQMIHDVHRPLNEMLLGLEGWIPMYMTGQVHPYYLPDQTNHHFMHFIRSAGTVAISGEAIYGKQGSGRYIVTRNKDDVAYYRQRAKDLLHRASPLMEFYRQEESSKFRSELKKLMKNNKSFHCLSNLPPLFTMSEELLEEIFAHNEVSKQEQDRIKAYHRENSALAARSNPDKQFFLELSEVTHEDYESYPARLPVSELFPESDIRYSEDEYRRHIAEAREFADENPWFSIATNPMPTFRNIDILIMPGEAVLVSKSNPPVIHFEILHPRMISAFEQFAPPIYEK